MPSTAQRRLRLVVPVAEPSTLPVLSDDAILAGLGRRDAAASVAFYARARPVIDRTLSRLLGGHDPDYEDVAQGALYEVVSSSNSFRGECPLDAWLSILTARVAYRHIRRRRLERRFFGKGGPETSLSAYSAPAAFASRQAVDRVRVHLDRMDAKRAWTFLLHDVYGYTLEQVGEIMGTSVSAAQSRLVRGRREAHERILTDLELAHFLDDLSEVP